MKHNRPKEFLVTPDPVLYWKIRTSIGDVERCHAEVVAATAKWQRALVVRNELLQQAAGKRAIGENFTAKWNDPTGELTFTVESR